MKNIYFFLSVGWNFFIDFNTKINLYFKNRNDVYFSNTEKVTFISKRLPYRLLNWTDQLNKFNKKVSRT